MQQQSSNPHLSASTWGSHKDFWENTLSRAYKQNAILTGSCILQGVSTDALISQSALGQHIGHYIGQVLVVG